MGKRAVIVGGGISGLATARALRAADWAVEIYERSTGLPVTGTALGMLPEAMDALDRLGIGDTVRRLAVLQRGADLVGPEGRPFARLGEQQAAHLISRPLLHQVLCGDMPDDSVTWGAAVSGLECFGNAELIVGADGINSVVRNFVVGTPTKPRPLGTVAFRGVVPGHVAQVTETWGRGRLFGITPQDAEDTNWFACVREELIIEHGDGGGNADLLRHLFHGWHPEIGRVLDQVEDSGIDRRPLYDVEPLPSYARGNVVVLGDAAHAMAPNLGRGGCESLIDAVALADALASTANVKLAYEHSTNSGGERPSGLCGGPGQSTGSRRADISPASETPPSAFWHGSHERTHPRRE